MGPDTEKRTVSPPAHVADLDGNRLAVHELVPFLALGTSKRARCATSRARARVIAPPLSS
jgi:hypothetical protein